MELADAPLAVPGPGQALVRIAASGVNFIDVYFRTGLYKAELPITRQRSRRHRPVGRPERDAGIRGRSRCVRDGPRFMRKRGRSRIIAGENPRYDRFRVRCGGHAARMTAHYLTHSTFPLTSGQTCLVHAAAGGTGRLIAQMAKMRSARVIGTVSTEEKAAVASQSGVDHPIVYTSTDFEAEVKRTAAAASMWSTTRSAGPRSRRAWAACGHAG